MTQEIRDKLKQLQISWARTGQRVLFLARRVVSDTEVNEFINFMEKSETIHLDNLVAVGMIGIVDRPRQGIGAVVRTCRAGGIRVVMVSDSLSVETYLSTVGYRGLWNDSRGYSQGSRDHYCPSWPASFNTASRPKSDRRRLG